MAPRTWFLSGAEGERGEDELWKLPAVTLSYLKLAVTQLGRNGGAGVREHRCVTLSLKDSLYASCCGRRAVVLGDAADQAVTTP